MVEEVAWVQFCCLLRWKIKHFWRGRSCKCLRARMLGQGWGVMWGCREGRFCCSGPQYGRHTHTHTHTQEHSMGGVRWKRGDTHRKLGVQSWSPFVTRKSGHMWRISAEMTQTPMPKSTKVAQIHWPERNSAKIRPKEENTHTHTEECTHECCTYPLATDPLKVPEKTSIGNTGPTVLGYHPCNSSLDDATPVVFTRAHALLSIWSMAHLAQCQRLHSGQPLRGATNPIGLDLSGGVDVLYIISDRLRYEHQKMSHAEPYFDTLLSGRA